jgi:PhnB protein
MTSRLNPYITFQGTARQAVEFYRDVFGGDLAVSTFGEYGGEPAEGVMHAQLETSAGFTLMASDTPEGQSVGAGGPITISLSGDDTEELTGYWEKLSADGTVVTPLAKQMWGDTFGMCTDKFGIGWLVNIAGDPASG